jgi:hypothetical protein
VRGAGGRGTQFGSLLTPLPSHLKLALAIGFAPALSTLSTPVAACKRPLLVGLCERNENIPGRSLPPAYASVQLRSLDLLRARGCKWYARPVTLRNPALIQCDAGYKPAGSL